MCAHDLPICIAAPLVMSQHSHVCRCDAILESGSSDQQHADETQQSWMDIYWSCGSARLEQAAAAGHDGVTTSAMDSSAEHALQPVGDGCSIVAIASASDHLPFWLWVGVQVTDLYFEVPCQMHVFHLPSIISFGLNAMAALCEVAAAPVSTCIIC